MRMELLLTSDLVNTAEKLSVFSARKAWSVELDLSGD